MERGDWLKPQPGDLIRKRGTLGQIDVREGTIEGYVPVMRVEWRDRRGFVGRCSMYPSYEHAGELSDDEAAWVMKRNLT